MRTIARKTLREFWLRPGQQDAKVPLSEWYHMMEKASWKTPQEIKADIRSASILKGGRVVFNIGGNKYRVIVAIRYDLQIAWIKFVGTHKQYDQIDAEAI